MRARRTCLCLASLYLPDDGIEKFAKLALKHNPEIRITDAGSSEEGKKPQLG